MNNLLTRKLPFAAVMLLLALCWSCSEDPVDSGTRVHEWNDTTINGDALMSRMRFSVGSEMIVERNALTRATTTIAGVATFSVGDLIAIAVTPSSGTEEIKLYSVKSDGSLEYAGGDNDPLVWKSSTVSIRAWSYGTDTNLSFTLTAPETFDYTLEADQQTNGYRELLYCKAANKSLSGGAISLTFYHQLARMIINVTHEKSTSLPINSVVVGGTTFPKTARFSVPTGDSNVGTWAASDYGTLTPKTETTQAGSIATYSAVIFPTINYAQDTKLFTVTNYAGDYVYSVPDAAGMTLTAGNQYNYAIQVMDEYDYLKNPLWYMGKYNVKRKNTSVSWTSTNSSDWVFDTTAGYTQGDLFQWASASGSVYDGCVRTFGSGTPTDGYYAPRTSSITITEDGVSYNWHLGTSMEWNSIFPHELGISWFLLPAYNALASGEKVTEPACTFGYDNESKYKDGNTSNKTQGNQYTSYWSDVFEPDYGWCRYAVRFIGTKYCSVWRYQYYCTNHNYNNSYIVVSSRIIKPSDVNSDAKLATFFTSGHTNCLSEKPEGYWEENLLNGVVQRTLYACGIGEGGNNATHHDIGKRGLYWTTTGHDANTAWGIGFAENGNGGHSKTYGFSVRLFRDEYHYAEPALGDKYYSDGTWGDNPHSTGATVIGIVAWLGDDYDLKCNKSHGLVMALKDASSGAFGSYGTDESFLTNVSSINECNTYDKNGLTNTNNLLADGHTHNAVSAARNYTPAAPMASGSTNWFLPSAAQWLAVLGSSGIGKYSGSFVWCDHASSSASIVTNINNYLTATGVGGTGLTLNADYWSSSENSNIRGINVVFNSSTGTAVYYNKKSDEDRVRAFLAF